jgi:hypothetical protein
LTRTTTVDAEEGREEEEGEEVDSIRSAALP